MVLILMTVVVLFYELFKSLFNIIRFFFFKKRIKKFLEIDLAAGMICFILWLAAMGNYSYLFPNQIFHSIFYVVAVLIFLTNETEKKVYNYLLFAITVIDIIIFLIALFSIFGLYPVMFFLPVILICIVLILRKKNDKLDYGYLMLSLINIANILLPYAMMIAYIASEF